MRNDPEVILTCLFMRMSGDSLRKVKNFIAVRFKIKVSSTTIHGWMIKYEKIMRPYADSFKINGEDILMHADEMMVRICGRWAWDWNVISMQNRILLASNISWTRTEEFAENLFKDAKRKIVGMPLRITTDGCGVYPAATNGAWPRKKLPRVDHYVALGIARDSKNNPVERFHNTKRQAIKTMRCFRSIETARGFMSMYGVFYNFLRPHMALDGQTPMESAGLFKGDLEKLLGEAYAWTRRHQRSACN